MLSLALSSLLDAIPPGHRRAGGVPGLPHRPLHADHRAGSSRKSRCSCRSGLPPRDDGEEVRFRRRTASSWRAPTCATRSKSRSGVLVFCHEFLSDRWSYRPYADALRDLGFDIFTFDFRNHGASASDPVYQPLQWVTDHEVRDLEAALAYLRSRRRRPRRLRPLRHQPGWRDRAGGCGPPARRLGRDHRRRVPDPRDDADLHPPLGGDLRQEPAALLGPQRLLAAEYLPIPRLGGAAPGGATALLPLPRHRKGRSAALAAPLADDPRRQGCLHRAGDRRAALGQGGRTEGTLDRARGQAQPLPRGRPRRLRRTDRVVPCPVCPPRPRRRRLTGRQRLPGRPLRPRARPQRRPRPWPAPVARLPSAAPVGSLSGA